MLELSCAQLILVLAKMSPSQRLCLSLTCPHPLSLFIMLHALLSLVPVTNRLAVFGLLSTVCPSLDGEPGDQSPSLHGTRGPAQRRGRSVLAEQRMTSLQSRGEETTAEAGTRCGLCGAEQPGWGGAAGRRTACALPQGPLTCLCCSRVLTWTMGTRMRRAGLL